MAFSMKITNERAERHRRWALTPGYVLVGLWVLFTFLLIGWVFFASFSTSSEIFSDHMFKFESGFHFENYAKAWKTQKVSVFFMNSLLYTLVSCTAIIVIAAPASYVLSRFKFRGNLMVQNMFAAALGIPVIMIIMPLFGLISQMRLTNNRWMLIFLYVAMNVPFAIFFLLAFFKNLSFTFEEAASIDGCSPMRTFWQIMLPLAQPGIVTVSIFNFITIWNEYFMSLIFANKTSVRPVAVGLYNMIQSMRYTGDWGGMFASVVIVFLPTFILYIFLSEKIIAGVTGGAIKG
ncbi:carbohydrate ABC transporter permease [Treponema brennaborense]|uniref:ABC-type transporter, integral membrane subunit n=1 Tax=Treponema brennaborense (strain DSM 12168 / CIP 105900 / DD5/3) TaxID=906968 RepID=F4LP09_TREBD|nr:carbohydrate ABC transporter permease [Treponema brennaborense]AEE17986.1 ABC-type transporter, integral membrane subunit [Treponema brennaborense DSM 12168]